ncbi:MAG TPA: nucleotidyltransferase family protein [Mycobacteriales bacterium]|nr:nucleotidyltransferase family protein [Mycobacteriales bacterium]
MGRAGRVLVACTRDRPPNQPVPELAGYVERRGLAELGPLAVRHGVVGCLWTALRTAGLADRPGTAELRAAHSATVAGHLRALADLRLVDRALTAAGVGYLVLKGPVLAGAVYRRPDLRSYVDVDVLVAPAEFAAALAALESAGCAVFERNWQLARDRLLGELRLFTPSGLVLDLHWHVIADRSIRAAFRLDLAAVRGRARTVRLAGRDVRTLDPADTVVHLALHAALAGGHRLIWLKDLEQALLAPDAPQWTELVRRAAEWRAGPATALMLARASRTLGVPVPASVLRRLVPDRRWRMVGRLADVVSPVSRGAGSARPSVGRIVARAARADGPASRHELARRTAGWVGTAITGGRHDRDRDRLFDPDDNESAAFPSGGPTGRAAYLDEVSLSG